MMKMLSITLTIFALLVPSLVTACENDREVDGYLWTFHRMDDGNTYHELKIGKSYQEGSSLVLSAPCGLRLVDSVQVEWSDQHGKMTGELVVYPGGEKLGLRDIDTNKRTTWAVQKRINRLEMKFGGPRKQDCKIKWIRIFYGKSSENPQMKKSRSEIMDRMDDVKTVDRIKFAKGPAERACRVMNWNGRNFIIIVDRGPEGNIRREVSPDTVNYIVFKPRWGTLTEADGSKVPALAKRFENGKLWFDKKINGNIVEKPGVSIDKYSAFDFND
ncbi:hypothetical protein JW979_05485 [bacterium]|nr:hypothetical protein [candidate division CSSED10-310 bacterium]